MTTITTVAQTMTMEEMLTERIALRARRQIKLVAACKSGCCFSFGNTRTYLSMGCVKSDDGEITWDSFAMERSR